MASLLEIAEAPAAYMTPRHPSFVEGEGFVLVQMGRALGAVQAIRLTPGRVVDAREEVRTLARERGLETVGWWTSDLSQPPDLGTMLGLEPGDTLRALALTTPPSASGTFEVRRVETLEDYAAAQDIDSEVHGWPKGTLEEHAEAWERARSTFLLWLALEDGRPVGVGRAVASEQALMLVGGATLPDARGRGAYRALVAARWQEAVARGTPALVTTANDQSGPILELLGFERLGSVEIWIDRL